MRAVQFLWRQIPRAATSESPPHGAYSRPHRARERTAARAYFSRIARATYDSAMNRNAVATMKDIMIPPMSFTFDVSKL